jgi:hypothetical protein
VEKSAGCLAPDCDKPHRAQGWCGTHWMRWYGGGIAKPRWSDKPRGCGYWGAHDRVERVYGLAKEHACNCGAPAAEWAYDHAASDEAVDSRGRPYSPSPEHYVAMCRSCHRRFDSKEK